MVRSSYLSGLSGETTDVHYYVGVMDQSLPVPIARHFYHEYRQVNPQLVYVELPRTGHTAIGNDF